ncbi:DUF397 domain-containing protein [Actinomadura syzygii]|uniref:DUF397 domain-containing protein n=1 Tax=Actinomadura syzygii TaxID=1427538 RepID=A0A5D0UI38_9ACTN|nr:DUF397 domain-containing protein [Actinomadura syzygii]TYC17440.1 DUF397 domain-containing protein [Actinomadura syzygii]
MRATATWRKSSHSVGTSNCVEVADLHPTIAVRDSKDPTGPALMLSRADWRIFTEAVKRR